MVFPHEVLVQLRLTGEVEVTDVTVEVGVAAGALIKHGSRPASDIMLIFT